jgi:hypothetical protein
MMAAGQMGASMGLVAGGPAGMALGSTIGQGMMGAGGMMSGAGMMAGGKGGGQKEGAIEADKGLKGIKEDIKDQKANVELISSGGASIGKELAESGKDIAKKTAAGAAKGGVLGAAKSAKKEGARQFKKRIISKLYLTSWSDFTSPPFIPVGALTLNTYWLLGAMNKPYAVKLKAWEKLLIVCLDIYVMIVILLILLGLMVMACLATGPICAATIGFTSVLDFVSG